MIFKYLTSIVKPCVFKLFSLRKITKSNFYRHLPTLNIANLFMQSFASHPTTPHQSPPTPQKSRTTNQTPHFIPRPTSKGRNYRLYPRPFYTKIHRKGATIAYTYALSTQKKRRKGATIAYTYALSTQKSTERAQLSEHGTIIRENLC